MRCLYRPQPALPNYFSYVGDAKANKGLVHSGAVVGRIARPSGWIGRQVTNEDESLDNHLGRVAGLKVNGESQDLVGYTYVGAARYVKIAYPEPRIELSYIKNSGEPERDSGDPYTGYDCPSASRNDLRLGVANRIDIVRFYQIDIVAIEALFPRCHRLLPPKWS